VWGALIAIDTARDAKADQVIGSSRYFGYNEEKSEIEIGWTFWPGPIGAASITGK